MRRVVDNSLVNHPTLVADGGRVQIKLVSGKRGSRRWFRHPSKKLMNVPSQWTTLRKRPLSAMTVRLINVQPSTLLPPLLLSHTSSMLTHRSFIFKYFRDPFIKICDK